jgi:hypothetical protein
VANFVLNFRGEAQYTKAHLYNEYITRPCTAFTPSPANPLRRRRHLELEMEYIRLDVWLCDTHKQLLSPIDKTS